MSELKVLFVCTGNAGRSQLAQALANASHDTRATFQSAGVKPWDTLHPVTARLMEEMGADSTAHYPKNVTSLAQEPFDIVISLGDVAREMLPLRMKGNPYRIHWNIADPAEADGTPDSEKVFRATLELLKSRVQEFLSQIDSLTRPSAVYGEPGINSGLWGREVLSERHIELVAKAGFKAIEVSPYSCPDHLDFRDHAHIGRIAQAAKDNGVAIWSLHSRDVGDLSSPYAAQRQVQLEHLRDCLDAADLFGAPIVVSHIQVIGQHFGDLENTEKRLEESMYILEDWAERSVARIALENGYAFQEGKWTCEMFERIKPFSSAAFGYVIDTGHANIAGDMDDIEAGVGDRLISLHLNDNAGEDSHWICGEGTVDWRRVAQLLRDTHYDGCLMWEIGNPAEDFSVERINQIMDGHKRFMELMDQ